MFQLSSELAATCIVSKGLSCLCSFPDLGSAIKDSVPSVLGATQP